jgi:hypothetical protein
MSTAATVVRHHLVDDGADNEVSPPGAFVARANSRPTSETVVIDSLYVR